MKVKETFIGFDALKKSVSMVQILGHYGLLDRLHRSGDNLSGACPIHAGHNQSQFRVSTSKNCWICFGDCHVGGSIVDFVSRKEGVGIRDAGLLIQDWFGIRPPVAEAKGIPTPSPRDLSRNQNRSCESTVNSPLGFTLPHLDGTHPYLVERGLCQETIQTFGVGCCKTGSLAGWIAIPIHNPSGQLVAYAARWPGTPSDSQPKYKLPKGFRKSLELFNLHRAMTADVSAPLVVVEGFFACIKIWQAGHQRVVAIMGSMLSQRQAELIAKASSPLRNVILMFDEDEAGRKGRADALHRLGQSVKVRTVRFDTEGAQPDGLSKNELMRLLRMNPS